MLPEAMRDTIVDTIRNAFPSLKIYRDWNDIKRDDSSTLVVISFGKTTRAKSVMLGNYYGKLPENPNYSRYAWEEHTDMFVTVARLDNEEEDTRAIVQTTSHELEIFIKREIDKLFNNLKINPYSFDVAEEVESGARMHYIMAMRFGLIYTSVWNDMPPENAKRAYDVNEIRVDIDKVRVWVKK